MGYICNLKMLRKLMGMKIIEKVKWDRTNYIPFWKNIMSIINVILVLLIFLEFSLDPTKSGSCIPIAFSYNFMGDFTLLIREIEIEAAENFINLIKEVKSQFAFMLMEPGEIKTTSEQQRNSTIFVAEVKGELVGYLIAMGGSVKRSYLLQL